MKESKFKILVNLLSVGAAAYEGEEYVVYDRRFDYMAIQILSDKRSVGLFDVESKIEWERL